MSKKVILPCYCDASDLIRHFPCPEIHTSDEILPGLSMVYRRRCLLKINFFNKFIHSDKMHKNEGDCKLSSLE